LRIDRHDLEAGLGDPLVAHLAWSANPLEDAGGVGRGSDRTGRPDVVRAVRDGTAFEVVAFDRALEALALGHACDLHTRPDFEGVDRHRLSQLQLSSLAAELDQMAHGSGVGLLQMAELRL